MVSPLLGRRSIRRNLPLASLTAKLLGRDPACGPSRGGTVSRVESSGLDKEHPKAHNTQWAQDRRQAALGTAGARAPIVGIR